MSFVLAYGVYVSQLICYASACSNYQDQGVWESAHYKVVEPGVSKIQTGSNTRRSMGDIIIWSIKNCF